MKKIMLIIVLLTATTGMTMAANNQESGPIPVSDKVLDGIYGGVNCMNCKPMSFDGCHGDYMTSCTKEVIWPDEPERGYYCYYAHEKCGETSCEQEQKKCKEGLPIIATCVDEFEACDGEYDDIYCAEYYNPQLDYSDCICSIWDTEESDCSDENKSWCHYEYE